MHDAAETVSARLAAPLDEAGLIRAAQNGDQDAFERLVRTYDQSVLRLAMNLLRSPDEARDVYQEAFLKVFRNLHTFRFDCSFHTWLYRIVTNVCLDHLRRRKVRKEESTVVETPEGFVDRIAQLEEGGASANPERQMWNRQLSDRIAAALEGLTPRERTVFELRHYEGLRLRAIGDILGTSEEAAKNCLFRATQKNENESGIIHMNCAEVTQQIPVYSYGEVSAELEELIESHLSDCSDCRQALARHRSFLEALDQREDIPAEAMLLANCRRDLRIRIATDSGPRVWGGWLESLRTFSFKVPAGAMALIALGWFGARYMPAKFGGVQAGVGSAMFSTVQSVAPDASGNIQIAVDDVQRRMVTGSLQDPRIQALLLSAVREENNPGVRVDSIGVLRNSPDSQEVRQALVDAVSHDPNAGVRLKALEGLKQYASDPSVRKTLANVLLKDDNPGVRVQAIDLLTAHHDDSIVGVLQNVMQTEDDSYIRTRCRNLLEAMKASVGTF